MFLKLWNTFFSVSNVREFREFSYIRVLAGEMALRVCVREAIVNASQGGSNIIITIITTVAILAQA